MFWIPASVFHSIPDKSGFRNTILLQTFLHCSTSLRRTIVRSDLCAAGAKQLKHPVELRDTSSVVKMATF